MGPKSARWWWEFIAHGRSGEGPRYQIGAGEADAKPEAGKDPRFTATHIIFKINGPNYAYLKYILLYIIGKNEFDIENIFEQNYNRNSYFIK